MRNFFEHQDRARSFSGRLVGLFSLGVIGVIAVVYLVVAPIRYGVAMQPNPDGSLPTDVGLWWFQPDLLAVVALVVGGTIAGASWYRVRQLNGGGASVALELGGRYVTGESADPLEQRLLNVVQEMAIASGVPVPTVFVLDYEPGINAFAAGYSAHDAAVAVTRGCLEVLDRDELQAVVAHEFSHILNGDMRLNIRLMSVLFGLTAVSSIGWALFRLPLHIRTSGDNNKAAVPILAIAAVGGVVMVAGWFGHLFGQLIRSAVSRQREFLADASAVQFTRNPMALGSALRKIGGYRHGAAVAHSSAAQMSHMFFGAIQAAGWMDTHPPLAERIRRVDANFPGTFPPIEPVSAPKERPNKAPALGRSDLVGSAMMAAVVASDASAPLPMPPRREQTVDVARIAATLTDTPTDPFAFAHALLESLPDALRSATSEPFGALGVLYGMLLSHDATVADRQRTALRDMTHPAVAQALETWHPQVSLLPPGARLPVAQLCAPALHALSQEQYQQVLRELDALMHADAQITLFEFALSRSIRQWVGASHGHASRAIQFGALGPLLWDVDVLLSVFARMGQPSEDDAAGAFFAVASRFGKERPARSIQQADGTVSLDPRRGRVVILPAEICSIPTLDVSVERLAHAAPMLRRRVLAACADLAALDGVLTVDEAELLRVLGDVFQEPVPALALRSETAAKRFQSR